MCSIFGYISQDSTKNLWSKLKTGLVTLEYKGHDMTAVALFNSSKKRINIIKDKGTVAELESKIDLKDQNLIGNIGLGYVTWADDESISEASNHSDDYLVTGIYSGNINNLIDIKERLLSYNYAFYSKSNNEIILNLIDYFYKKYKDINTTIRKTLLSINGSIALSVVFKDDLTKIWFAKKESSLIVALNEKTKESYISSDTIALTDDNLLAYPLRTNEYGYISATETKIFDLNANDITSDRQPFNFCSIKSATGRGKFKHYLIKEIEETPKAIKNTLNKYIINKDIVLGIPNQILVNTDDVYFIGSGSSYNAGLVGEYLTNRYFHYFNTKTILASEFIYKADQLKKEKSIAIFLSQSGETQDTLTALEYCKLLEIKTLAITNVKTSRLAFEADYVLYTEAFPEVSLPTTKSYSCQLILLYLIGAKVKHLKLLQKRELDKNFTNKILDDYIQVFKSIPAYIEDIFKNRLDVQKLATTLSDKHDIYLLGGVDFPTCCEGALKLKEICGIHAEAIPAGELKHGSLSLIDKNTYCILISTGDTNVHEISAASEIKARGGKLIVISSKTERNKILKETTDLNLLIPEIINGSQFLQSLTIIYLQLLAYYIAIQKGINPDKPRNLARSVIIE